jgi:hypothetical protein
MLDLPPDSLGPKPTKKQMALLQNCAKEGAIIHTYEGVSLNSGGAYIKHTDGSHDKITKSDVWKFLEWGWLQRVKHGFPGSEYIATDRARAVIKKGETRK